MKLGGMKIKLEHIPIGEVVEGYFDDAEKGCRGYGGKLNIRPAFQREFVYSGKQRDKVIETVKKNFPWNIVNKVDTKLRKMKEICRFKIIGRKKIIA